MTWVLSRICLAAAIAVKVLNAQVQVGATPANAALRVVVCDPSGARVPHATAWLKTERGELRSGAANQAGELDFDRLTPGAILLHIEAAQFTANDRSIRLRAGENRTQVRLHLAVQKQFLVVSAKPREEMTTSRGPAFSNILTPEEILGLPDDPDEMKRVLEEMAGPGAVILVDGFAGGRLPPKSQIASIRFRYSPYTAEEHDLGFSMVDIRTKAGYGAWHGTAGFTAGGREFNARNFFSRVRAPQESRRLSVDGAGPVVRNKTSVSLWLAKSFSYDSAVTIGSTPSGPFSNIVRLPLDDLTADVRVRHTVNSRQSLLAEVQHFSWEHASIGQFDLPERLSTNKLTNTLLRLADYGVLSTHVLNDIRFQANFVGNRASSVTDEPAVTVSGAFNAGGAGIDKRSSDWTVDFNDDATFQLGRNGLRTGVQFNSTWRREHDLTNAEGTFIFSNLAAFEQGKPEEYTRLLGSNPIQYIQNRLGMYLQDETRLLPSLSLSAGMRWEMQSHVHGLANMAPRIGFAWSPFKNAKITVRGGVGIFYQWVGAGLYGQAMRMDGTNQSEAVLLHPGYPDPFQAGPSLALLPPTVYRWDPALRIPYLIRSSMGAERQFGRYKLIVEARIERGFRDLWLTNLGLANLGLTNLSRATGVSPGGTVGNVYQTENGAFYGRREGYLNIVGHERIGGKILSWNLGYTLSRTIDEVDGPLQAPTDQHNPRVDRGPASSDARNRLSGSLSSALGNGFRLTSLVSFRSALPYNITTGFDNNGDTIFNDRPRGTTRNSARGAADWGISSRFSWTREFGPAANPEHEERREMHIDGNSQGDFLIVGGARQKYQFQIYVQAFNLLNHANFLKFDGVLSSPLFGQPTSADAARRFEMGLKCSF